MAGGGRKAAKTGAEEPVTRGDGNEEPAAASEVGAAGRKPLDVRHWLPYMGLVVAVWASLPRYSGPGEPRFVPDPAAEFANHVVPALAIALASLWVLAARRRAKGPGAVPFFGGLVVLLGGLFMVATHAPLVAEALRDEAPWDATIYHTSSALAVFGLGLLWAVSHWSDLDSFDSDEAPSKKKASKGEPARPS